ncbi:MAG: RedB protein [Acidobacteriota bacterium]
MFRRIGFALAVCLWIALVCAGMGWLWSYSQAAGPSANPPAHWPRESAITPIANRHTLVMLVHPKCPCTRASMEELSKLMTNCAGRLNAHVLFLTPKSAPHDWYRTDTWSSAARIPGVTTIVDHDGKEAARFGALTSGQVVLYDTDGRLVFTGGITASRGHMGDNAGRGAIEALVNTSVANITHGPAFGCPLFNPGECPVPNHEESWK